MSIPFYCLTLHMLLLYIFNTPDGRPQDHLSGNVSEYAPAKFRHDLRRVVEQNENLICVMRRVIASQRFVHAPYHKDEVFLWKIEQNADVENAIECTNLSIKCKEMEQSILYTVAQTQKRNIFTQLNI